VTKRKQSVAERKIRSPFGSRIPEFMTYRLTGLKEPNLPRARVSFLSDGSMLCRGRSHRRARPKTPRQWHIRRKAMFARRRNVFRIRRCRIRRCSLPA
jgi:hypothetical protein